MTRAKQCDQVNVNVREALDCELLITATIDQVVDGLARRHHRYHGSVDIVKVAKFGKRVSTDR